MLFCLHLWKTKSNHWFFLFISAEDIVNTQLLDVYINGKHGKPNHAFGFAPVENTSKPLLANLHLWKTKQNDCFWYTSMPNTVEPMFFVLASTEKKECVLTYINETHTHTLNILPFCSPMENKSKTSASFFLLQI